MTDETAATTGTVDSRITIPEKKALPKAEKRPSHKPDIPNYADDEDLAKKVSDWFKGYKNTFDGQAAWWDFYEEMDIADELYRAAACRTSLDSDQQANVKPTGSQIKSATFYSDIRAITAGQKSVILGSRQQLPVVYEPIPGHEEPDQGKKAEDVALGYNLELAYTMEQDRFSKKLGSVLLWTNKYANHLVEMAWDYRKEKRRWIRKCKPESDEQGKPVKTTVKWVEEDVTLADWPTMISHDMKDCGFDSMIPEMQNQNCIYVRDQTQQQDLWQRTKTGEYKNLDKVGKAQLYTGENTYYDVLSRRQANANEAEDANTPNGLFDRYRVMIRVPINDDTGKWDPEGTLPHWYEAVFIGPYEGEQVCMKLVPHWHHKIPFELLHSHEDDKGALSLGYSTLVKSLIAQEMTSFDQAIDCNTKRINKPMIVERGSLSIKDKTFSQAGNQIWWKTPGSQDPHEMEIQDTTITTFNMLGAIEERRKRAMGRNKATEGEALGGRASASESIQLYEQALKPALEDSIFLADQILPFYAYWTKEMWDTFGDPNKQIAITYEGKQYMVDPSALWGDVNIRVVSIKRFQDSIIRRKEDDLFFNTRFPLMQPHMSEDGIIDVFTQDCKSRGYDNVETWWKQENDFDAKHVAKSENVAIVWNGIYDMPKPGENDKAHLAEHKPYLSAMVLLPEGEKPPDRNIQMMKMHMQIHEQQQAQGAASTNVAQQSNPAEGPRTDGEAAGDVMGAMAGAEQQGQAPTEMGGRPPEAGMQ